MVTPVIVPISPTNNSNVRRRNSLGPNSNRHNNTHNSNNRTGGGGGGVVISNCVLCILVLSAFSLFVSIEYGQILPSMVIGNISFNNNNNNNNNIKRQTSSSSSSYASSSSGGGVNSIITSLYIRTSPTATYSSSSSHYYYGKEQDEQRQEQEEQFYYAPAYNNALGSDEIPPPTHNKLPRVALLMSFPNSHGIGYTLREVRVATNTTTATTYWGEFDNKPEPIIPYIKSPYQLAPELPVPSLVLTKTFCAADCLTCIPPSLANVHEFQKGCRSFTAKRTSGEMAGQFIQEHFADALVSKVVHFVRSPFDTVLDRMKSGTNALRKSNATLWTDERLSQFNATTDGIIAWCNHVDRRSLSNSTDFDSIMHEHGIPEELYRNLPCKTEWYRYTQFHNLASKAINEMQTPAYVLYYENYGKKFRKTVRELLNFLELAHVDNFSELPGAGWTLVERYGDDFGKATAQFVKAAATPECWSLIKHYFNQWKLEEEDVTVS